MDKDVVELIEVFAKPVLRGIGQQLARLIGVDDWLHRRGLDSYMKTRDRIESSAKSAAEEIALLKTYTNVPVRKAHEDHIRRKWINVVETIKLALPELEATGADNQVGEEFLYQWADHTGTIEEEEIRRVWARLLVIEASGPGGFSRRAMSSLRDYSRDDATCLRALAKSVVVFGRDMVILESLCLEKFNASIPAVAYVQAFRYVTQARELSLIAPVSEGLSAEIQESRRELLAWLNGPSLTASTAAGAYNRRRLEISVFPLTTLGQQLCKLPEITTSVSEVEAVAGALRDRKIQAEIRQPTP